MTKPQEELQQYLRERGIIEKEQARVRRHYKHKESTLQQNCVSWLKRNYPDIAILYDMIANGVPLNKTQAKIAKSEGLTKGAPDTFLFVPARGYHGLAVEFKKEERDYDENGNIKVKRTYQEPEQKQWQAAAENRGYLYKIVWTKPDFEDLIKWYLEEIV